MGAPRKILILGCGYLGRAVAGELRKQGVDVTGWVRTVEGAGELPDAEITPWIGDLADPADWEGLPGHFDSVVHCASSGRGDAAVYRHVYLEGVRRARAWLPESRLVFISSTSVYGQEDGSAVTEESAAEPKTETGKVLREAEEEALRQPGAVVLRTAGLYGPGRGVLLKRFRAGEAVIEGEGSRFVNQVHRDDAAGAVLRALVPEPARLPGGIYNVCDDGPVSYLDYYGWLAKRLGRPMPPHGPADPDRKRGLTNKRVSNARLRASGWAPRYPTFREGLDGELGNA